MAYATYKELPVSLKPIINNEILEWIILSIIFLHYIAVLFYVVIRKTN